MTRLVLDRLSCGGGKQLARVCGALALACLLWGPPAHAGTYEVEACTNATGPVQNAFAASADSGMAAYSICPNTPSNPASGIVTRASATAGAGSVPYFAGAYQVFHSPPGATLASVSFDVAAIRLAGYWTTGIIAYDNDFNVGEYPYGCYAGNPGCAIGTRAFVGPVTAALYGHAKFRFETRCVNPGGCDISSSGSQLGMRALFSAANVRVRVQDFTAPSVTPSWGSLFGGGWLRGHQEGWSLEYDNVGVMVNRASVDGKVMYEEDFRNASWPDWVRCNFTRPRPCTDIPGAVSRINTRSLSDGSHELRVEVLDAAGNHGSAVRGIKVDNTPPPRVNVEIEGGDGWRRHNSFSTRWSPTAQVAPVTKAHYRLCTRDANAPRCSGGSRTGTGIDRLSSVSVPAPGDYDLTVWLEDEAGNVDPALSSDPVRLRFDDVPPQAAFEPLDDSDPTKLDVRSADSVSGVAGGVVEIRRAGWRQWRALHTTLLEDGRLSARLDDLELADEKYELRARVRDHAGNERTTYEREDGSRMTITLPLRLASRIALRGTSRKTKRCARAPRKGGRRRCRGQKPRLRRAGRRTTLSGSLETSSGKPLAAAPLGVFEQARTGGGFRKIVTLRSNAEGRFNHVLEDGPSRTIRLRYEGTPLIKPAVEDIAIRVPARTTINASRRFLLNGETVRLGGRLAGRPVPDGGKLIDLQAFYRGSWRTFATPRSDGAGRWSYRYRFEATSGLVRYRFRARIRREAAYPYVLGYSRVVAVTVRGR